MQAECKESGFIGSFPETPRLELPPAVIDEAAAWLRQGGLVAFPTETVYGLGADCHNEAAVRQIFAAKGRPADHPLIVHIASAEQMDAYAGSIPPAAWTLAQRFWPGPLTLVLPRRASLSPVVTGGQDTVALRVPAHPVARQLLAGFGRGVAAPSANRFGRISPTLATHVRAEFDEQSVLLLDGGPCAVGLESTIVDLTGSQPYLLRPGAISAAMIEAVIGVPVQAGGAGRPRVPGQLKRHYAPRTPLRLLERRALIGELARRPDAGKVGVLAIGPSGGLLGGHWINMPADPYAYGQQLYASLRALDEVGLVELLVQCPPDLPAWQAIHDRLSRAAAADAAQRRSA